MKQIFTIFLLAFMAIPVGVLAGTSHPTDALLSRIDKEGGKKVLSALWEDEKAFNQVLLGIESGDKKWLEVAVALRPHADGGASLSLNYAVARALPKAPVRVLRLAESGFTVDKMCTSPFIEPEPGVAKSYEKRTLAALFNIKEPALKSVAAECARRVRLPHGV